MTQQNEPSSTPALGYCERHNWPHEKYVASTLLCRNWTATQPAQQKVREARMAIASACGQLRCLRTIVESLGGRSDPNEVSKTLACLEGELTALAATPDVAGGTIGLDGDTKREELVCRRHDVYYDPENKICVICELRAAAQRADAPEARLSFEIWWNWFKGGLGETGVREESIARSAWNQAAGSAASDGALAKLLEFFPIGPYTQYDEVNAAAQRAERQPETGAGVCICMEWECSQPHCGETHSKIDPKCPVHSQPRWTNEPQEGAEK